MNKAPQTKEPKIPAAEPIMQQSRQGLLSLSSFACCSFFFAPIRGQGINGGPCGLLQPLKTFSCPLASYKSMHLSFHPANLISKSHPVILARLHVQTPKLWGLHEKKVISRSLRIIYLQCAYFEQETLMLSRAVSFKVGILVPGINYFLLWRLPG